ncbi:MAG: prenyltransferase [Bacillota bacterium]
MAPEKRYQSDIDAILARRYDNGWDYWTTPDKRLIKGTPFSALESALLLIELGIEPSEPVLQAVAELLFGAWREDGRFKLYPDGAIYPCHTINAVNALCRLGYASDPRLLKTFEHLLQSQYGDSGWRCNKFSFGRGPETEFSNPGPTLTALNAFRFTEYLNREPALDRAVEFLLGHYVTRAPLGPCHYGIGTLFMQVEYPFGTYNLFSYVYTLSFYERAKKDPRFLDALAVLESKLVDGQIVVERVNRKLAGLTFCKKGAPSELGTKRYQEIRGNLIKA